MIKKIYTIIIVNILLISDVIADKYPTINAPGIPGNNIAGENGKPGEWGGDTQNDITETFLQGFISDFIKYIAVFAVIALMVSGIMMMLSGGEEEKTKKAKTWFTWSLVGVIVSMLAWFIINTINELQIG